MAATVRVLYNVLSCPSAQETGGAMAALENPLIDIKLQTGLTEVTEQPKCWLATSEAD